MALLTAASDAQTFWGEWREQPDLVDHHTDDDPDRYGRVDHDNDEGATVVTVHVESASEGYDLVVADRTGALTVRLDGHPMTSSPVTTNVEAPVSWTGSGHDGPDL